MHLDEKDVPAFTKWAIKRLDNSTDADSDVLAEYVLALIRSDEPDKKVKSNCLENLTDFLHENTEAFVTDVFTAVRTKSFRPDAQRSSTGSAVKSLSSHIPTGPAAFAQGAPTGPRSQQAPHANGFGEQSRKRGRDDNDLGADGSDRGYKQRRGDRLGPVGRIGTGAGRGQRNGGLGTDNGPMSRVPGIGGPIQNGQQQQLQSNGLPGMPQAPSGFPSMDMNNPMAALVAMQALMAQLPGFPGMPPMPVPSPPGQRNGPQRRNATGKRCFTYDNKGFCEKGNSCHYDHGDNHIVVTGAADEYDPQNASLNLDRPLSQSGIAQGIFNDRGAGRGRGYHPRGRGDYQNRGGRAAFSAPGPSNDPTNTAIVVERIPEENFTEEAVRGFFEQFGQLDKVDMQPYKRLAILHFADHDSARSAWGSPKVIFDNRFVKCYWYKPEHAQDSAQANGNSTRPSRNEDVDMDADQPGPSGKGQQEPEVDPAELQKRQEEAQRTHEEKTRKLQEAIAAREELDRNISEKASERQKLLEKLAAKGSTGIAAASTSNDTPSKATSPTTAPATEASTNGTTEKKSSQTEALRARLAALEAEAESIGLNPNEYDSGFSPRGRGRGAPWRGRGRGRGGQFSSRGFYGAGRGAGSFSAGNAFGGVKRLDNRPKRVAVLGIAEGGEGDEGLRQFLFNNYEFENIGPHPERKDAQVVGFKERYVAEKFIAEAKVHPALASVEMSWMPNPNQPSSQTPTPVSSTLSGAAQPFVSKKANAAVDGSTDPDVTMGDGKNGVTGDGQASVGAEKEKDREEEYDVAEDDDRWMDTAA